MFDIKNNVKSGISMDSGSLPNESTMGQPYQQQNGYQEQQPVGQPYPQQNGCQSQQPVGQPYPQQNSYQSQQPIGQPHQQQNGYQTQQPIGQPYQQHNDYQTQQPVGQPYQQQSGYQAQQPMGQNGYQAQAVPVQQSQPRGVSLIKGQKVNLSKMNPNLDEIDVCLGWDVGSNANYDLDSEVFLLGSNDRVVGDAWFVFYNQAISPDGAVKHSGDNKTGQGEGDDEIIHIKLSQVNPLVEKMIFIVTINNAKMYGLNFGNIKNAFIRVVDKQNNRELVHFQLSEYYKEVTSMMVGELYKKSGEWRFNPIGSGTGDDLEGLCSRYGVNLL